MCIGGFNYCKEAVDSVESVTSCPTSKSELESAANKKNCQLTAAQQKCSEPETFLYHCVINGYGNETIEVCALRRLMIGNVFNQKSMHGFIYSDKRYYNYCLLTIFVLPRFRILHRV